MTDEKSSFPNSLGRRRFVTAAGGAGAWLAAAGTVNGDEVTKFGTAGDGVKDDTEAIQRAIDSGTGGVFFPKGAYRITKPIEIDLAKVQLTSLLGTGTARIIMEGAGPAFHFIGTHTGSANPESFHERVWDAERFPLVSGIEIFGSHDEAVGIRFQKIMQPTVTGVLIRRCKIALHFVERNRNPIVDSCHIYHNREIGIYFDHVDLHQAIISNSHISYNAHAGIYFHGGALRNFQIVGNDIEYNYDLEHEGSADILMDHREDNTFREGTIVGNTIQAVPSPGGANIRFLGGKDLLTGGLLAITGNLIGSQTDNIHLSNCRGVTVSGNSIYSAARNSIHLEKCHNITIGDNAIDWNPNHNEKKMADGICIEDSHGVSIGNTIIEDSHLGSAESGGTITIRRSSDVSLSNCQILDPQYRGIVLENSSRCRIANSTIADRLQPRRMLASIEADSDCKDTIIANNYISSGSLRVPEGAAIFNGNIEIE